MSIVATVAHLSYCWVLVKVWFPRFAALWCASDCI